MMKQERSASQLAYMVGDYLGVKAEISVTRLADNGAWRARAVADYYGPKYAMEVQGRVDAIVTQLNKDYICSK